LLEVLVKNPGGLGMLLPLPDFFGSGVFNLTTHGGGGSEEEIFVDDILAYVRSLETMKIVVIQMVKCG
jgi:hypothetical protein